MYTYTYVCMYYIHIYVYVCVYIYTHVHLINLIKIFLFLCSVTKNCWGIMNFDNAYTFSTCILFNVGLSLIQLLLQKNGLKTILPSFLKFILVTFVRERKRVGEGQRERERENPKQAPFCLYRPYLSRTLRSWPEPKSRLRGLTDWAPRRPCLFFPICYQLFLLHVFQTSIIRC